MTLRLLISVAAIAVLAVAAHADTPHGVDLTAIDKSVTPGDDFYRLCQWQLDQAHRNSRRTSRAGAPSTSSTWKPRPAPAP